MASLISGYEYDIFISYRQKDNKGEKWVSEFVDTLKTELESTFKEEIDVYFDINPHDGLLETHDVDASLKEKLKCLIFIPIISRTYCDPKSFAWEHEFKTFVELASSDQFGLKVKLPDGNIASRVLPVQIHDLNSEDRKLVEGELGGYLRGIEFIYKEPGVNRPLMAIEDHPDNNLNKTIYRNQINKVANAINEIIVGLRSFEYSDNVILKRIDKKEASALINLKPKIIIAAATALLLILLGYYFIPKLFKSYLPIEKSIAVLPFANMSNDPDQEYFSTGIMEEILNHLFKIGGLDIPSSTSSMRFKASKLPVKEIARTLNVSYILEGSVSRSGDQIIIRVRLVKGKNERLLWSEDYTRSMNASDLFEIQSDIAQQVAENMNIVLNPEVKKRIESKPTLNTEAYTLFLQARSDYLQPDLAISKLEKAILFDPEFADAYALSGYYWVYKGTFIGNLGREQVLAKAEPLLVKALQLDKNSPLAHIGMGALKLYYYWDFKSVEKEYQIFNQLNPSNSDFKNFFLDYLLASGKYNESLILSDKLFKQDKYSSVNWVEMAYAFYYNGQPDSAIRTLEKARLEFPDQDFVLINSIGILDYLEKYGDSIELFEKSNANNSNSELVPYLLGHLGIAYFKTGNVIKSGVYLNELIKRSNKTEVGSPSYFAAAVFVANNKPGKALQMLEKAYTNHEVEMYWLNVEPLFKPLHGDPQFERLLKKIGFK